MAQLPQFQDDSLAFQQMQNKWAGILNPIIANPINNGSILKGVTLVSGANVINHLLGRTLQGWSLVDNQAPITVYRSGPKNNLTLTLTASGPSVVDLLVF